MSLSDQMAAEATYVTKNKTVDKFMMELDHPQFDRKYLCGRCVPLEIQEEIKISYSIRKTVRDDFVPLALSGQGEDQTRQQQFRPTGLRAGGGK